MIVKVPCSVNTNAGFSKHATYTVKRLNSTQGRPFTKHSRFKWNDCNSRCQLQGTYDFHWANLSSIDCIDLKTCCAVTPVNTMTRIDKMKRYSLERPWHERDGVIRECTLYGTAIDWWSLTEMNCKVVENSARCTISLEIDASILISLFSYFSRTTKADSIFDEVR